LDLTSAESQSMLGMTSLLWEPISQMFTYQFMISKLFRKLKTFNGALYLKDPQVSFTVRASGLQTPLRT
jgi:hypothetical protein